MLASSISNSKLHCCLAALILFILIFLSLPLFLIYLANSKHEKCHRNPLPPSSPTLTNQFGKSSSGGGLQFISTSGSSLSVSSSSSSSISSSGISSSVGYEGENCAADHEQQANVLSNLATNCTQYAFQADLTLSDENFHCPIGTFPCQTCPGICIEQWRNCDGHADCPDRSDENSCHDSNGAIGIIFQSIVNIHNISNKSSNAASANSGGGGGGGSSSTSSSAFAKPESCTLDQFVAEQCPCVYTDPRVIICENLGLTSVPSTLLSSVYKIRMSNNSITTIDGVLWPRSLVSLVLVNNRITHIGRSTFETAPNLSKLYLSHNEISYIDNEAFAGLTSLTSLQIEANKLRTFDSRMLKSTPMITKVYLSENMIDLPEETRFGDCENLKELFLDYNKISIIRSHWFSNMTSLIWLSLMHNEISAIEDGAFNWNYELEELNLSFNRIKFINRKTFARNLNIQRLYLGDNPLRPLPVDAFKELVELRSLNLTNVQFDYIINETFLCLTKLEFIYFAKFRYCHYANHVRVCRPSTDGLSSVEDLLAFPILKYAVWIVASVCSLGNVFVFIWRSVSPHEDCTLSLFIRNLSMADLMMGIYLGAIGWQNWKYQHKFGRYANDWMSSWTCTAIGFLAILSSELSVFILTIITIERWRSIISTETFEEKAAQQRRARFYVASAWILSFLIASYPLVEWLLKNSDYYATNGLCLPLHIDAEYTHGWLYSAIIYLGINFSAVMVIIGLYAHMYCIIMKVQKASKPALLKAEKREEAILAIRFFFIVVTDCLCWIPIVVIKIMAMLNVSIAPSIYGWLVVFIIPINSALNPIVYTLAAPTSLRAAVCRLFERICYKVDMLAAGNRGSNYSSQSSSSSASASDQGIGRHPDSDQHSTNHCQLSSNGGRRRRKTGSNSTTCDTIDTSISSQQSSSRHGIDCCNASAAAAAEFSATIHATADDRGSAHYCATIKMDLKQQQGKATNSGKRLSPPIYSNGSSIIDTSSSLAMTGTAAVAATDNDKPPQQQASKGNKFYQRCHVTAVVGAEKDSLPYKYLPPPPLSTYDEDKPITERHKLISGEHQTASAPPAYSQVIAMPIINGKRASFNVRVNNEEDVSLGQSSLTTRDFRSTLNRRRFTNPSYNNEEEIDDVRSIAQNFGQIEVQMLESEPALALKNGVRAQIVERSYIFPNELATSSLAPNIPIDMNGVQIATSPRQSRVSFDSKDSRTCLLSQTDSC